MSTLLTSWTPRALELCCRLPSAIIIDGLMVTTITMLRADSTIWVNIEPLSLQLTFTQRPFQMDHNALQSVVQLGVKVLLSSISTGTVSD